MPPAKKATPPAAAPVAPEVSAGVSEVDKAAAAELAALGLAPAPAVESENAELAPVVLSGELPGAICGCFPGGWGGKFAQRSDSVTCQHGVWNRWDPVGE